MTTTREDAEFVSGTDTCAAWVHRPDGDDDATSAAPLRPVVVLAHGLGGTREMGLSPFAERFAEAGIVAVTFDYRTFGASGGAPRQVLSVPRQQEDIAAALAFAATLPGVDPGRVALWGTSFGGGHAIHAAAHHPELAAVVAQCPFTDGLASSRALGVRSLLGVAPLAVRDELAALLRRQPVLVPLAAAPGAAALMTAADAEAGCHALVPAGRDIPLSVAARIGTRIGFYRPGVLAPKVTVPLQVGVCLRDSVAPAATTLRHLRKAPAVDVRTYDHGHFDIYVGEAFEEVVSDQVAFLRTHLLGIG